MAERERCLECHGEPAQPLDPRVVSPVHPPRLEGQPAGYLRQQLQAFRDGRRRNPSMALVTAEMSPEDISAVAAWFAARPVPPVAGGGARAPAPRADGLLWDGDAARGLPACAVCHGPQLQGAEGPLPVPRIAGLHRRYLVGQLQALAAGERVAPPGSGMNTWAARLSAQEIEELASRLAAYAPPPGGPPSSTHTP